MTDTDTDKRARELAELDLLSYASQDERDAYFKGFEAGKAEDERKYHDLTLEWHFKLEEAEKEIEKFKADYQTLDNWHHANGIHDLNKQVRQLRAENARISDLYDKEKSRATRAEAENERLLLAVHEHTEVRARYHDDLAAEKLKSAALVEALEETNRLLEGLSSGREIGTDYKTAGDKAKRYAYQIQMEVRAALKKHRGGGNAKD